MRISTLTTSVRLLSGASTPRLNDWETRATIDPAQIGKWWGHSWEDDGYLPNIGIAMGKSALLGLDFDSYKDCFDGDSLLTTAEQETTTALSGGGGQHLIYEMPSGKSYGNAMNTLPKGLDIRGCGGLLAAAPSLHKSGRRYQYEAGYDPIECQPQPLPEKLIELLDAAAQSAAESTNAVFTDKSTDEPLIDFWGLSSQTMARINKPAPRGERSEADMSVCVALVYAGKSDDDILAVFEHCPIGTEGKFAERGRAYLARTIGRARSYVEENPQPLGLEELLAEIASFSPAGEKPTKAEKEELTGVIAPHVERLDKARHGDIEEALIAKGFSKTASKDFTRACRSAAKERKKAERRAAQGQRERAADEARADLGLPIVVINDRQIVELGDDAMQCIDAANKKDSRQPVIYQRGNMLGAIRTNSEGSKFIRAVDDRALFSTLGQVAVWVRQKVSDDGEVRTTNVSPPLDVGQIRAGAGSVDKPTVYSGDYLRTHAIPERRTRNTGWLQCRYTLILCRPADAGRH